MKIIFDKEEEAIEIDNFKELDKYRDKILSIVKSYCLYVPNYYDYIVKEIEGKRCPITIISPLSFNGMYPSGCNDPFMLAILIPATGSSTIIQIAKIVEFDCLGSTLF
jgi:hypothetical protein